MLLFIDINWKWENSVRMFIYNLIKEIKSPADSLIFLKISLHKFHLRYEALSHVCKRNAVELFIAEWLMTSKNEEQKKKSHLSFSDTLRVKLHDTVGNHITYKVNSFLVFQNNNCEHDQKKNLFLDMRDISSYIVISEAKLNLLVVKLKQIRLKKVNCKAIWVPFVEPAEHI